MKDFFARGPSIVVDGFIKIVNHSLESLKKLVADPIIEGMQNSYRHQERMEEIKNLHLQALAKLAQEREIQMASTHASELVVNKHFEAAKLLLNNKIQEETNNLMRYIMAIKALASLSIKSADRIEFSIEPNGKMKFLAEKVIFKEPTYGVQYPVLLDPPLNHALLCDKPSDPWALFEDEQPALPLTPVQKMRVAPDGDPFDSWAPFEDEQPVSPPPRKVRVSPDNDPSDPWRLSSSQFSFIAGQGRHSQAGLGGQDEKQLRARLNKLDASIKRMEFLCAQREKTVEMLKNMRQKRDRGFEQVYPRF